MCLSWLRYVLTLGCAACTVCACAEAETEPAPREVIIYKGGGPYPTIAQADFLSALGRARSALLAKCCDYIGRNAARTDSGPPAPSSESGALYNEAAGSACIGEYHALSCPHGKEPPGMPASCRAAYAGGTLQAGATCTTDWECELNLVCAANLDSDGLARSCEPAAEPLLRAGELCRAADSGGSRCEPPMICREDGRCALPQLGEPCVVSSLYGDTCDKGSVCDRTGSARCAQPTPTGSACASESECELYACIDGVCAQPVWGLSSCTLH